MDRARRAALGPATSSPGIDDAILGAWMNVDPAADSSVAAAEVSDVALAKDVCLNKLDFLDPTVAVEVAVVVKFLLV